MKLDVGNLYWFLDMKTKPLTRPTRFAIAGC